MKGKQIKWTKDVLAARAWFTSGRTFEFVCPQCSGNGIDMTDKCSAALDKPCPGFQALERAHQEFEANYFAIINGEVR